MKKTYCMDVKGIPRVILPNYIDDNARNDLSNPFIALWVHHAFCPVRGIEDKFVSHIGTVKILKY